MNAVEDFLMKRWNLYKNIIYHHRVVKTDYLLQNIIIKLAEDYFKEDYGDAERDEKISGAFCRMIYQDYGRRM